MTLIVLMAMFATAPPTLAAPTDVHRAPQRPHHASIGAAAARYALRFRGVPYVWGGSSPAGFDCSGFTRYVYAHFHIDLPHSSYAQWTSGRHIRRSRLRPGDLVFFGLGHVGLWTGHGGFIHAPQTGQVVSTTALSGSWYADTYTGAVRIRASTHPA